MTVEAISKQLMVLLTVLIAQKLKKIEKNLYKFQLAINGIINALIKKNEKNRVFKIYKSFRCIEDNLMAVEASIKKLTVLLMC